MPEIVLYEAEIVKRIFSMYLSGQTIEKISETLQSEHIVIPGRNLNFSLVMIMNMLKN